MPSKVEIEIEWNELENETQQKTDVKWSWIETEERNDEKMNKWLQFKARISLKMDHGSALNLMNQQISTKLLPVSISAHFLEAGFFSNFDWILWSRMRIFVCLSLQFEDLREVDKCVSNNGIEKKKTQNYHRHQQKKKKVLS